MSHSTQPQQPLDYARVKAALEAELRRVNALLELREVIRDMKAWLKGDDDDDTTPPIDNQADNQEAHDDAATTD